MTSSGLRWVKFWLQRVGFHSGRRQRHRKPLGPDPRLGRGTGRGLAGACARFRWKRRSGRTCEQLKKPEEPLFSESRKLEQHLFRLCRCVSIVLFFFALHAPETWGGGGLPLLFGTPFWGHPPQSYPKLALL